MALDHFERSKLSVHAARHLAEVEARIAELEAALGRLWDNATTITVDGQRGCFVHEGEWRRLVVDVVHSGTKPEK